MLSLKLKLNSLVLSLCVISTLFLPAQVRAETDYETGDIAATRAADQRAALAKKAEERKKRAAEKQKAAETQKAAEMKKAEEAQKSVEEQKKPDTQIADESQKENAPTQ
jgi:hypothetical protein